MMMFFIFTFRVSSVSLTYDRLMLRLIRINNVFLYTYMYSLTHTLTTTFANDYFKNRFMDNANLSLIRLPLLYIYEIVSVAVSTAAIKGLKRGQKSFLPNYI